MARSKTLIAAHILLAANGLAAAETPEEKGRALALEHCSRCHVIDDSNPFGGIASTPSFKLLVTALADWKHRFETFHTRLPHPSVIRFEGLAPATDALPTTKTVDLKLEDIDSIVAFVSWLKAQQ